MWTPVNKLPAAFGVGNHCGGPPIGPLDGSHDGALYAEDIRTESTSIPNGSRAGWLFAAPEGTTITAISLYRRLAAAGDPDLVAGLYQGDGVALEECKVPWPMQPGGDAVCSKPNLQAPVRVRGSRHGRALPGRRLPDRSGRDGVRRRRTRSGRRCRPICTRRRSRSRRTRRPSISNVGGALWNGGVVSGVVPVTFTASDATGIKEQSVRLDGDAALISAQQSCDFSVAQPCPQQPLGSLNVDTTRVPDGPQTFSLAVTDAADNTQVVTSPPVIVDNHGPPPPVGLTATADGANAIVLTWGTPLIRRRPSRGRWCRSVRRPAPPQSASAHPDAARVAVPGPGLYSVRMWLLDALGRGGPHNAALASVKIALPVAAPPPTATTTVRTLRTKIAARAYGTQVARHRHARQERARAGRLAVAAS